MNLRIIEFKDLSRIVSGMYSMHLRSVFSTPMLDNQKVAYQGSHVRRLKLLIVH